MCGRGDLLRSGRSRGTNFGNQLLYHGVCQAAYLEIGGQAVRKRRFRSGRLGVNRGRNRMVLGLAGQNTRVIGISA